MIFFFFFNLTVRPTISNLLKTINSMLIDQDLEITMLRNYDP